MEGRKLWDFGPGSDGADLLVGSTYKASEVSNSVQQGFQWATREGSLCGEKLHGVKFSLLNATLHADSIHRGGWQIIPTASISRMRKDSEASSTRASATGGYTLSL